MRMQGERRRTRGWMAGWRGAALAGQGVLAVLMLSCGVAPGDDAPGQTDAEKPAASEAQPGDSAGTAKPAPAATTPAPATGDLNSRLKAAARAAVADQTYQLSYRARVDESIRWKVTHLVTVDTKIRGGEQTAKTRSVSTKSWRVTAVEENGDLTFVYQVEDVDMWQAVTGRQEVRYNSRTDEVPPREYELAAKSVGVPLATVKINRYGRVLQRDSAQPAFNPGLGELTIPLPERPVKLGAKWHVPEEIKIRLEDGRVQRVQTRQAYTLDKVETGVATISVRTEVLTPVNDPKVHSQLVQRLTNGTVKFDLEAGRVLSRQMDLDETVIGFSGSDSVMQYLARLSEELSTGERSTGEPAAATAAKPAAPSR